MTAPAVNVRRVRACEITDTSVLLLGGVAYPVAELDLFVTQSGARSVQIPGEGARRPFLPGDTVTLVVPAEGGGA